MQANHLPLCTIAGSDPTGGAGLQGDLRTFAALGARGTAVVTAVTVQDRERVTAVFPVPPDVVGEQLEAALAVWRPAGCKTGMLWSGDTIRAVAEALTGSDLPLVVDPVLRASVGQPLAEEGAVEAYRSALLPCATVVTPNADEAGALLGIRAPAPGRESEDAAKALLDLGCDAVVLTGGDSGGERAVDVVATRSEAKPRSIVAERVEGAHHGTGCAFSAALTCELAAGASIETAVVNAKAYVLRAMRAAVARGDAWRLQHDV